ADRRSALAAHTVAVTVEAVDVGPGDGDGSIHVRRPGAAATCTVDVAVDGYAAAVVRVARPGRLRIGLRFRLGLSVGADDGDLAVPLRRDFLVEQRPRCLDAIGELDLVGERPHAFDPGDAHLARPG